MADIIRCPLCRKEVGEYVFESVMTIKGLGAVRNMSTKYDGRKVSNVYWDSGRHKGRLCRKCAKANFPEGKYYTVTFNYHGKEQRIYGGIGGGTLYATRASADESAKRMTARGRDTYRVRECEI